MALLGNICIIGRYRTDRIEEELQVVLLKDLQVQCYSELRFWEDSGYPLLDESFWIFGLKNGLVLIGSVPLPTTSAADFRVAAGLTFARECLHSLHSAHSNAAVKWGKGDWVWVGVCPQLPSWSTSQDEVQSGCEKIVHPPLIPSALAVFFFSEECSHWPQTCPLLLITSRPLLWQRFNRSLATLYIGILLLVGK